MARSNDRDRILSEHEGTKRRSVFRVLRDFNAAVPPVFGWLSVSRKTGYTAGSDFIVRVYEQIVGI